MAAKIELAYVDLMRAVVKKQPTLIVLEDLHYIDIGDGMAWRRTLNDVGATHLTLQFPCFSERLVARSRT